MFRRIVPEIGALKARGDLKEIYLNHNISVGYLARVQLAQALHYEKRGRHKPAAQES